MIPHFQCRHTYNAILHEYGLDEYYDFGRIILNPMICTGLRIFGSI
jgi:hypothetical protein